MPRPAPLSPHLTIYRLPLTALLSISHRISGVFLSIGLLIWLGIVVSLATSPTLYAPLQTMLLSLPGRGFTWAFVLALFLHLSHGIRHLFWDAGYGLERDSLTRMAMVELIATLGLTLGFMAWVLP